MKDCIFCKIVRGEVPAHVVYDDEYFMAFLDIHPLSPGHTLVIPKIHYRWVWDVPQMAEYFGAVTKIAKALRKAYNQDMILSRIVGEEIHHAHVWVFPSNETAGNATDFITQKEKIVAALKQ